ncbi:carboxylic ester hydrolase-5 [Coleophoma cylindrospora]|uniref:Carboxylic ester hydrolase n=1 Tax=Coleophoma cylindrospora TaxID=1849047 RepID=A0A3D8QWY8_9HELO|nr:carboxylic ester hydrolase-5 [Coleophoma cylindrospora]
MVFIRQYSLLALAGVFLPATASPAVHARALPGPRVQLDNGLTIQGGINTTTLNTAQYLGIPYAQSPLGDLRFAPPQAYSPSEGTVINGTALPPSCMQYLTSLDSMITVDMPHFETGAAGWSEDCLTVSVWTPLKAATNQSLPVVIWFFGGGFTTGGVDVSWQLPGQWVDRTQDHIVVAINYRINIFGFPNAAGLEQQNLGLLDQRLAIEWTQANIAKFGGDASRMVLIGQSAGSEAVDFYNFAYHNDTIVKGLIMHSGTAHLDLLITDDPTHSDFSLVAANVGCGNQTSAAAELACMRKVPASALEQFLHTYQDAGTTPSVQFNPVRDDIVVFTNYTEKAMTGGLSNLPAIIGNNAHEGFFLAPYTRTGVNETIATTLSYTYFWCPSTKTSYERLAAGRTTYRYMYEGNFTNISPKPWLGAVHGSELPILFGTHANYYGNSTALEYAVSHAMQDAYVAFAKDPVNGLATVGWPAYESAGGDVRVWARDGQVSQVSSLTEIEAECKALGMA